MEEKFNYMEIPERDCYSWSAMICPDVYIPRTRASW